MSTPKPSSPKPLLPLRFPARLLFALNVGGVRTLTFVTGEHPASATLAGRAATGSSFTEPGADDVHLRLSEFGWRSGALCAW